MNIIRSNKHFQSTDRNCENVVGDFNTTVDKII